MPILPLGGRIDGDRIEPPLPGRWSVWSQAGETPGGYFVTPLDDDARSVDIKYAVIRAKQLRTEPKPELTLIRTDPHKPELLTNSSKENR